MAHEPNMQEAVRPSVTRITGARALPHFNPLTVIDVRPETRDAVSVAFEPGEFAELYRFIPGEFLTLQRRFGGEEIRRCYSISSGLDDRELRVVIKKVPGGIFSEFANTELRAGMTLDVMTPTGTFTKAIDPGVARNYVGFAVGSGITPIISIVRSVLSGEPDSHFTLFYGNRDSASIIFREALQDLKDIYLTRLSVVHFLSREVSHVALHSGRIDAEKLVALSRLYFDPSRVDMAFLCGPGEMVSALREALVALGLDSHKVRQELFTPSGRPTAMLPREEVNEEVVGDVAVTAILNGVGRRFRMKASESNIVDAARANGIALPYSCKGGMCATCRARVTEGAVTMAANYSLEAWELESGYVLTCQARPSTPTVTVDYDHV